MLTCQGQKIASISGYQAAFGGDVKTVGELKSPNSEESWPIDDTIEVKATFWGIIALVAALAGLVTSIVLSKKSFIIPLASGVIGILAMALMPGAMKKQVFSGASIPGMELKTQFGYWLSLLAFLIAAVITFLASRKDPLFNRKQVIQDAVDQTIEEDEIEVEDTVEPTEPEEIEDQVEDQAVETADETEENSPEEII